MSNRRSESEVLQKLALGEAIRHQMDGVVERAAETVRLLKPRGKERSDPDLLEARLFFLPHNIPIPYVITIFFENFSIFIHCFTQVGV